MYYIKRDYYREMGRRMVMRYLFQISVAILVLVQARAYGQAPEVEWEILLGDTMSFDTGLGAFQTSDGGYIVGGNMSNHNGAQYDNVLFKLDSNGDTLWSAAHGGSGTQENASCFRLMPNGSYMFSGYSNQDPGGATAYLFNADPDGSYGWTGIYGSDDPTETAVCPAASGDTAYAAVTGYWLDGYYGYDFSLYFLSMTGWPSWVQSFHQLSTAERPSCLQSLTGGGYIICGKGQNGEYYDEEVLLVRLGPLAGIQEWKLLGDSFDNAGIWAEETSDGGFIVTGYTKAPDGYTKDVLIIKTDETCTPVWQKTYGFFYHDQGMYCKEHPDGGYVVGAICRAYDTFDFWFLRLDSQGDTLWTKVVERPGDQSLYSVDITDDGGYLLCGNYVTVGNETYYYVVKLEPDQTGIDAKEEVIPWTITLEQNRPNPFNSSTTISYSLAEEANVSVEIFDLNGRKVETIEQGVMHPGSYDITWDAGVLASGVYFYRINGSGESQTRKMLYLK